ncbi:alpha/beta hydrolase [Agromyces silvae]|uniref:alpha/beta hydrolase n=1 Tax=Agromyces silvae TaxID=3388266 RepID=UPI00280C229D|nr:alpha/beta fold hydrolase [Agromyces protaetiae]
MRRTIWGAVIAAVAAIAAVAIVVVGITGTDSPAPSATASATPDIEQLAGPLASQTLDWHACDFSDPITAPLPDVDVSNVECATVQVPRDWHDSTSPATWDVEISQARNVEAGAESATTLFLHPGGPFSGLSFAATTQHATPELRPTTNYVSFDQRGLGQSSSVVCEYEYDAAGGAAADARAAGEACSQHADFATMTSEQIAYDMDLIRHLLGAETVSYLGYSYGTWLGTWFGNLFAENIDRMVLDSVIDGSSPTYEKSFTDQSRAIDRHFEIHMMNWLARNDAVYGLGTDPEAILDRYFEATAGTEADDAAYLVWSATGAVTAFNKNVLYPIAGEVVVQLIADGESGLPGTAPERAVRTIERMDTAVLPEADRPAVLAAVETSTTQPVADPETGLVESSLPSAFDYSRCADGQWTQGSSYWAEANEQTAEASPLAAQLRRVDTAPMCAFWPTEVKMPPIASNFPATIVVQSELDALTPWEQGRDLVAALPDATSLVVDNEGVHGVFPYNTAEVDEPLIEFLLGGERPSGTIVAPAKPLPLEQRTFESWAPLRGDAEHDGPAVVDPATPAETAVIIDPAT